MITMLEKFKLAIKKESIVYFSILLLLTLVMHSDLLSEPLLRIELMYEKGNYFHPFFYTSVIYSIALIIRLILNFLIGLFEKKH